MTDYVRRLDDDRLEEWLELFTEDCVYKVIPRENVAQGLAGVVMVCFNKNMLRDRVSALRVANEYNIHIDRHIIGNSLLKHNSDGSICAETNYALFQTDQEGESRLFSVGCYEDIIVVNGAQPLFKERIVIVDTCAI